MLADDRLPRLLLLPVIDMALIDSREGHREEKITKLDLTVGSCHCS